MEQKFRLNGKNLFLTYPQCPLTKETVLDILKEKLDIENYVISKEAHENGDPHLHVYLELKKKKNVGSAYLDLEQYHGNYQNCKNKWATIKYVKKGGDFITNMEDLDKKEEARDSHKRYLGQKLISGTPLDQLVEEEPQLIFGYKKLKQDIETYMLDKKKAYDGPRECLWIYGEPGIGKSQWVYRQHPTAYRKDQSKWWDGYNGEEVVVMEDVDTHVLGHYLKIWGDNYPCSGEVKGAKIPLLYKSMIITSNYKISTLWKEDPTMAAAIARRFKTVTVTGDYENGYQLKGIDSHYLQY